MVKKRPSTRFVTAHSAALHWPRCTDVPSVFTAFVRGLEGARTPDADLFHDAWHGLRAALVREMKRRGLWQSRPSYLGVYGWKRWDSEAPRAEPRSSDSGAARAQVSALGELVVDCYAFIFVDRLQSLKRHLVEKPDIEGLVFLNVRHFLLERQREHDPLGFRIFELLQDAVEEAVSSGALHVLAGDRKVRNDTLLAFDPAAERPPTAPDLQPIVACWNDELMPDLVTALGRRQVKVARRLRELLSKLPQRGVEVFRFKDLLDPLKRDARGRWVALLGEGEEGDAAPLANASQAPAPPGGGLESRQSFEHLTRSVSASIDRMAPSRTRTQLTTLWHYLRRKHGGQRETNGRDELEIDLEGTGEYPSSYRQLSQRLDIPRERLPLLFGLLRQFVPR